MCTWVFTPKPLYENEHVTAFWDVPLFADTTQVKANRIDATVIDKTSKQVRVIEMSCPWLENRESKDFEKTKKYSKLRLERTNRYPEYKVNQYNVIMDVLWGCSKEVEKNIKELVGDECESIMRQMQKAILSSSLHIASGGGQGGREPGRTGGGRGTGDGRRKGGRWDLYDGGKRERNSKRQSKKRTQQRFLTSIYPSCLCRRNAASMIALESAEWFDLPHNFLFWTRPKYSLLESE